MPLLFLLIGVGVVAIAAAARTARPGPILYRPPGPDGAPAGLLDGVALYRTTMARWAKYRLLLGGIPPAGTAELTAALQSVADAAGAPTATKEREAAAFKSAVSFLFTPAAGNWFQRAWDFAKALSGTDPSYDPALLEQAQECQRQSLLQGWPTVVYSAQTLTTYGIFSAVRTALCFPIDQYTKLDARRAAALKRLYAAVVLHSKAEPGTLLLRFSQGALIADEYSDAWRQAVVAVPYDAREGQLGWWLALCATTAATVAKKTPESVVAKLYPFVFAHIVTPRDTDNVEHPIVPDAQRPDGLLDARGIAILQAEIADAAFAIAAGKTPTTPGMLPPAVKKSP